MQHTFHLPGHHERHPSTFSPQVCCCVLQRYSSLHPFLVFSCRTFGGHFVHTLSTTISPPTIQMCFHSKPAELPWSHVIDKRGGSGSRQSPGNVGLANSCNPYCLVRIPWINWVLSPIHSRVCCCRSIAYRLDSTRSILLVPRSATCFPATQTPDDANTCSHHSRLFYPIHPREKCAKFRYGCHSSPEYPPNCLL